MHPIDICHSTSTLWHLPDLASDFAADWKFSICVCASLTVSNTLKCIRCTFCSKNLCVQQTHHVCIIDNVMVTQIWKWACKKCTFMSLSEEMHFGNWQKERFCEDKKKNSQLLSCRFVGENPAGLTFRCQLENATPISHFHFKKAKPFFPNALSYVLSNKNDW